jgi:hypothetical protein
MIDHCGKPCATYHARGKLRYRKYCVEHYRAHQRQRFRQKHGVAVPIDAPALRPGHYVLFDLPHQTVYVVNGNQRSVQPYPKATVNPHTIALLKLRELDVRIIEAAARAA